MSTRRDFLRQAALGSAALVIGIRRDGEAYVIGKPGASFAPNAWIAFDERGLTHVSIGKQEMGQGVRTALAMIIADEADADWASIRLIQAKPSPVFPRLGTGGSFSIGGSWQALRDAGAAARMMMTSAAAARWTVPEAECRTEKSIVTHTPTGRRLAYAELTAAAAALPVPTTLRHKTASERTIIGTPMKRLDAPDIVSGKAVYGLDVRVPGMLFATILRAPVLGATVRSFDAGGALRVRGVQKVVQVPTGVAVIARNSWAAIKGRQALRVSWNESPHASFDSAAHWRALEAAAAQQGVVTRRTGESVAAGTPMVEARYFYPWEAHAPLEPMNCTVHVRPDGCDVWVPTQAPNSVQNDIARLLGLPPAQVTVTPTFMGGGFGRRLRVGYAVEAAEVARQLDAPVQVFWTRDDDMRHGFFQNASIHDMQAQLENGRITAWRHKKVSSLHNVNGLPTAEQLRDAGAYFAGSSWGVYDIPYDIASIETSYVRVDTLVPIGPWRAVFSPSSTFARECFIDELAISAGQDPIAFRLAMLPENTVRAGQLTIDRRRLRGVLELVREKSGWTTPLPAGRARGFACNTYDADTHIAYVVEVSAAPRVVRGRLPYVVHRVVCAVDCGIVINPLGVEQQVESGVIWALCNTMAEITFQQGSVQQRGYADFPVLRLADTPVIETHIVPSHGERPFGMGEPPVPPLLPAVANALSALTGRRIRKLPVTPA